MANALKQQVPQKYDAVLDTLGLSVVKGSYNKSIAPFSVPRFSTGQINHTDGSKWQAWAQTEWLGGSFQEFAEDPTKFSFSEGLEVVPGVIRMEKNSISSGSFLVGTTMFHNVIVVQGRQKTFLVVNDSSTIGSPQVRVYRLGANADGYIVIEATVLTLLGTHCTAATFYQGMLALSLGTLDFPVTKTAGLGTWGICLYTVAGTLVKAQLLDVYTNVNIADLSNDWTKYNVFLAPGEDKLLCSYFNYPCVRAADNVASTNYGPRPAYYTMRFNNAATPTVTVNTPILDPVTEGDDVTSMANVAGTTYMGTVTGRIYAAQRTNPTTAADSFSKLMDISGSFAITAMTPYGGGILFGGIDTGSATLRVEAVAETVHYRIYQLSVSLGTSRSIDLKKILDLPSKNPHTSSISGTPKWLYVYGTDIYAPSLVGGGVLHHNGYGWRGIMGSSASSQTEDFCVVGGRTMVLRQETSTNINMISSSERYVIDGSATRVVDKPYLETSKHDAQLPDVDKIARRIRLTTKPWPTVAVGTDYKPHLTIKYRVDSAVAWTTLTTIVGGSAATILAGGTSIDVSFPIGSSTLKYRSLQLRLEWDPKQGLTYTENIEITDIVLEYVLAPPVVFQWSMRVIAINELELNDRTKGAKSGKLIADTLWALAEARQILSYVDRNGVEYSVIIEDVREPDPKMAAGSRVDELESFLSLSLLEVAPVP